VSAGQKFFLVWWAAAFIGVWVVLPRIERRRGHRANGSGKGRTL